MTTLATVAVVGRTVPAFDIIAPVLVVGAGGCGLCAALAASDAGADVLVLERDGVPRGSTAMSTGLIPAAGTAEQTAAGIDDSPERFSADIVAKTKGTADVAMAVHLSRESARTVSWLREDHGVDLSLLTDFLYPGHSAMRMYGMPNRSGEELMAALADAAERAGVVISAQATARTLFVDDEGRVLGVEVERPDGTTEAVGCDTCILASCGFGGDATLVADHLGDVANAVYHGHPGNRGDALRWGLALGAATADLSSYQGHGGLAAGHGIPILWPSIMEGGIQINRAGERFSDESAGYSEQAAKVLDQPDGVAWTIFDERVRKLMLSFEDYRLAEQAQAVRRADDATDVASIVGAPVAAVADTLNTVAGLAAAGAHDGFGRRFDPRHKLVAPYYVARVTGALFHTQGGLVVDEAARVLRPDGSALPNLFAGGGAARGVSGSGAAGYLAGNGLLCATTLGRLAGTAAARMTQ